MLIAGLLVLSGLSFSCILTNGKNLQFMAVGLIDKCWPNGHPGTHWCFVAFYMYGRFGLCSSSKDPRRFISDENAIIRQRSRSAAFAIFVF